MTLRRASTLLLAVAQLATGTYLLVYLFRWQWNRAVIAGVLFVATEILLVGRLVLERLRRIEERLDAPAPAATRAHLAEHRPVPVDRFRWLHTSSTRTNVFLPLLLGAGVLASAATWVVEGIARRTARPVMERSLGSSLAELAFPPGGFLGPAPVRPAERAPSLRLRLALTAAAVAVVVGTGALVDIVADATQTRPDEIDEDVTTLIDLRFRGERALDNPVRYAEELVGVCAAESFRRQLSVIEAEALAGGLVRVEVAADLGEHGVARMRGCLEDLTLDGIQAQVAAVSEVEPAN